MKLFFSKCLLRSLRLGQVGLSTMSLGQILEKSCVHSKGHYFDLIFMKQSEYKSAWNLGHVQNWVILDKNLGH